MWKIRNKIDELQIREEIPKYEKVITKHESSNVVKTERKKLYDYYKCDYCGDEIKILKKRQEMAGGVVTMPHTVTRRGDIKLALCNKCLKPVLNIFEAEE